MKKAWAFQCGFEGCKEWGHFQAQNQKESSKLCEKYSPNKWRCTRHSQPEELLSKDNKKIITTITAKRSNTYPELTDLFWDSYSGFIFGSGYKAFANDFPEGTKLIVTAEIILPGDK